MIYHCIRFTVKPEVAEEEKEAALAQMREHMIAIPSIQARIVGPDIGGEFEYGAVSVLADLGSYEEYMNHPAHLAMDRVGLPLVDKFVSYDIVDDPDPEVGKKIAGIHRRRFENAPDIAELVTGLGEYSGSAAPVDNRQPRRTARDDRHGLHRRPGNGKG